MDVKLTEGQAAALREVLDVSLRDMSHEIADTDNSQYRARLIARRHLLEGAALSLRQAVADEAYARYR